MKVSEDGKPLLMGNEFVRVQAFPSIAVQRSTQRTHNVMEPGEQGKREEIVGVQEPMRLPVCCLFSTSNIGSQPLYRFGEEPGKPLKTLMFSSY